MVTAREVGAADRVLEEDVADDRQPGFRVMEDDMAGRVAGAVADVEGEVADGHLVAVDKIAVGFERPALDAIFPPVLLQPVDPEEIVLVRAFDRHAELLGKYTGLAAMVDMAVGEQDLLDHHAGL